MKKILLALALIVGTVSLSSAQKVISKPQSGTATTTAVKNPLAKHHGKKLLVKRHTKNGTNVNHPAGDFMRFNSDGTYEQTWNGTHKTGTYTYTATGNSVTINIGNTLTFTIGHSTTQELLLKRNNEEVLLIP